MPGEPTTVMNPDIHSQLDSPQIRRAIDRVCDEFEREWFQNPDYRIEDILDSVGILVGPMGVDWQSADVVEQILAELIHVEMDLRFAAKEEFDEYEYKTRFPDLAIAIDQAIVRIKQLDSENRINSVNLVATAIANSQFGPSHSSDWTLLETAHVEVPTALGPFQSITQIGKGGFGVVCRAVDSRNNEKVALKFPRRKILLNDQLLAMFLEEASRAQQLDHPGIVRTYSVLQEGGYLAIVQQLIAGTDLKQTLEQERTHIQIAELIANVADALSYAGRQGIVHRDLKPSNILIDEQGRPYIADFGMALHESVQLDSPNQRCGTPPYMSPQLVAGLTKNLDGRTDIWSLGVILYELLAGKRPFRGRTVDQIFAQIETRDPKPLRQMDPSIDKELERICLKCLARPARDRYLTADDLADDLRHWIQRPKTSRSSGTAEFVPKGLRSYSFEDAGFFMSLLPGPRDRDEIPANIRFWKVHICGPENVETPVPIGVIYGPSGSGKSSFVKAGLIPQIKPFVETIYVESTQSDTEVRLIRSLRDRFPEIPRELSLPAILSGLSNRRWQSSQQKVLLVLDQFEQRLNASDNFNHAQLAKALRHCDGRQLQCLLLVRDDFWMALTRFADALEIDLREGENSQNIDLFDRNHAKQILIKLGRAYNRLPDETTELSDDQHDFLDQAVDQLAVGNYVICVRLTLFAEMFKFRPWTVAELRSVGGIQGVGEKFLEETFGADSHSRRHKSQCHSAQAVLETLLPEEGLDIRGGMKSEAELLAASSYEQEPDKFKNLIDTLDKELRLITATDPDTPVSGEFQHGPHTTRHNYFQLTHDYLVPAIRSWLYQEKRATKQGRAQIRFRELAAGFEKDNEPRWLPTASEFISIVRHVRLGSCSPSERQFFRQSLNHHLSRTGVVAVALMSLFAAFFVYRGYQKSSLSRSHVGLFMSCEPEAIPAAIELLKQNPTLATKSLRNIASDSDTTSSDVRVRSRLGLSLLNPAESRLIDELLNNVGEFEPGECVALLSALRPHANRATQMIDEKLKDTQDSELHSRLEILRLFHDPRSVNTSSLKLSDDLDVRTGVLLKLNDWHGDPAIYAKMLDAAYDPGCLAGVLTAIGNQSSHKLTAEVDSKIITRIQQIFRDHDQPVVHATAAWALRRLGEEIPSIETAPEEHWYVNALGVTMMRVRSGRVTVSRGSADTAKVIDVDRPFFVASEEVAIGQFRKFLEFQESNLLTNADFNANNPADSPGLPVTFITLDEMVRFCNWLSAREGFSSCYVLSDKAFVLPNTVLEPLPQQAAWIWIADSNGYRLPTFSEWELAAGGGTDAVRFFGSDKLTPHLGDFAWFSGNSWSNGQLQKQQCGQKIPNAFGLFDVLGNISEICWDSPFEELRVDQSIERWARGGSFHSPSQDCKTSKRDLRRLLHPDNSIGFRIVRTADK